MGVKNSVGLNNVLNVINLIVWVFIMIAGLFFIKSDNWSEGQFLPFGWPGVSPVCHPHHVLSFASGVQPLLALCSSGPSPAQPTQLWPEASSSQLGPIPPRSSKPEAHGDALPVSPATLRINSVLFLDALLESQIACESIHQEMSFVIRLTAAKHGGSPRKGSGGSSPSPAEGEILMLAAFQ